MTPRPRTRPRRPRIFYPSLLIVLLVASIAGAGYFAYPFVGKWNNTDAPITLGDYDYQDIQNLRRDGERLKGVRGHVIVNSNSTWDGGAGTYIYPDNAFHYAKTSPTAESHVLVQARDSSGENSRVYQNETAIPSQGEFNSSILFTASSDAEIGRFSLAPNGFLAYADGDTPKLWGGDEFYPVKFYTATSEITSSVEDALEYSDDITNMDTSLYAVIGGGGATDANTVLLLHLDGADGATTTTDSSTSGHSVAMTNGAELDTGVTKFGVSTGLFDGTNDYLSIPDSDDFAFGSGAFTIDMWVRWTSNSDNDTLYAQDPSPQNSVHFLWNSFSQCLQFWAYSGGPAVVFVQSASWTPTLNQWYHLAVIRGWGGEANSWAITIDGTRSGSVVSDSSSMPNIAHALQIGNGDNYPYPFTGNIDEVRVSKGVARWIADFTPPAMPYSDSSLHWLIGSQLPLTSAKFYIGSGNSLTSTMTAKERQASGWQALSITDNTASGGISLANTGTVTWTDTGQAARFYLGGLSLYWYQFAIDDGEAQIYSATTSNETFQDIPNIWSGDDGAIGLCYTYDNSVYNDYTVDVQSEEVDFVAVLDSLTATTEYLLVGLPAPQQGVTISIPPGKGNSTASTDLTVYYRGVGGWSPVSDLNDATSEGGAISLSKSGAVTWKAIPAPEEYSYSINESPALYWYKFVWDAAMDSETEIYHITGIEAPVSIPGYSFPVNFSNRLFLFSENGGDENKGIYSAYNTPWVFNGDDAGELYFGDGLPITAAAPLYNVYLSSGIEQLIVTTGRETFRLEGTGPDDWSVQRVSGVVGCTAPLSMTVCGATDVDGASAKRQVVMFVGASGVYMCDGAKVTLISDDIRSYWDPNHANYITPAVRESAVGWYDPTLDAYKLVMGGVELEYSLKYGQWTKLYREDGSGARPLIAGFPVVDTSGGVYTYGVADDGNMYRLEYGSDWNGVADIEQYVWTKDFFPGTSPEDAPMFKDSTLEYFRLLFSDRVDSDAISFEHWCNGTQTTDGVEDQVVPAATSTDEGPIYTTDISLGPCLYHSFKITCDTGATDGLEMQGMGAVFWTDDVLNVE